MWDSLYHVNKNTVNKVLQPADGCNTLFTVFSVKFPYDIFDKGTLIHFIGLKPLDTFCCSVLLVNVQFLTRVKWVK